MQRFNTKATGVEYKDLPVNRKRSLMSYLIRTSGSRAEVARKLGITKAAVDFRLKNLGLRTGKKGRPHVMRPKPVTTPKYEAVTEVPRTVVQRPRTNKSRNETRIYIRNLTVYQGRTSN